MALKPATFLAAALVASCASAAFAEQGTGAPHGPPPNAATSPSVENAPAKAPDAKLSDVKGPDTWIFSGILQSSKESFSGTLVASGKDAQFELKLGGGATCDGSKLNGDVGLVRLPEITCTDDRTMRALFVPQKGNVLKVFGHVGDDRFAVEAHLLGTEAPPTPKQTAQPQGPLGLPPLPPGQPSK